MRLCVCVCTRAERVGIYLSLTPPHDLQPLMMRKDCSCRLLPTLPCLMGWLLCHDIALVADLV